MKQRFFAAIALLLNIAFAACNPPVSKPEALRALPVDSMQLELQIQHVPEQQKGVSDLNCVLHFKLTNGYSDTVFLVGYSGPRLWGGLAFDTSALFIPGIEHLRQRYYSID